MTIIGKEIKTWVTVDITTTSKRRMNFQQKSLMSRIAGGSKILLATLGNNFNKKYLKRTACRNV